MATASWLATSLTICVWSASKPLAAGEATHSRPMVVPLATRGALMRLRVPPSSSCAKTGKHR